MEGRQGTLEDFWFMVMAVGIGFFVLCAGLLVLMHRVAGVANAAY
jgi:hypothetical protein